ncbi:MAG: hypothetical protein ACPLUI_08685 [Desulfofundulus sp.]
MGPGVKISEVRGQWFERGGVKIMPTFHPAAVFRGRDKLELLQQDMEKVAREISRPAGYDQVLDGNSRK